LVFLVASFLVAFPPKFTFSTVRNIGCQLDRTEGMPYTMEAFSESPKPQNARVNNVLTPQNRSEGWIISALLIMAAVQVKVLFSQLISAGRLLACVVFTPCSGKTC
jgi:hypothetical protein